MTVEHLTKVLKDIFVNYSSMMGKETAQRNEAVLMHRLKNHLRERKRLDMILLGFPYKSTNTGKKVFGSDPDFGELAALQTLGNLTEEVRKHVPSTLYIVSDGHVFNDLYGVSDQYVDEYFNRLQVMNKSTSLKFMRLHDFLGDVPPSVYRGVLLSQYADNLGDITAHIHEREADRTLYTGLKHFMTEDLMRKEGESNNRFSKRSGEMAKHFMQRSQAYSRLVAEKMPEVFRLSIHPYNDWSEKMPIRLAPSSDRWATPWHNVAVYNRYTDSVSLMHRSEAEQRGYRLEEKDGRPWRFITP